MKTALEILRELVDIKELGMEIGRRKQRRLHAIKRDPEETKAVRLMEMEHTARRRTAWQYAETLLTQSVPQEPSELATKLTQDVYQQLRFAWQDHNHRNPGTKNHGLDATLNAVADVLKDPGSPWWRVVQPTEDADGAALRMAVKAHLHLGVEDDVVSAWQKDRWGNFQTEVLGDDPMAATRRAITRAAEIKGKAGTP